MIFFARFSCFCLSMRPLIAVRFDICVVGVVIRLKSLGLLADSIDSSWRPLASSDDDYEQSFDWYLTDRTKTLRFM